MANSFLDYAGLGLVTSLIKSLISKKTVDNAVTTEGAGDAYTATVDGITALTAGVSFVMVPHVTSTVVLPSLDVNGLGAKKIRRRVSNSTVTTVASNSENWLYANKPVRVTYDGTYWIADLDRPNATDIYGTVAIANGGTGASTAASALTNLGAQAKHVAATASLLAADWDSGSQTVAIDGVTETYTVIVVSHPSCQTVYAENGVLCTAQGENTLTFTCESTPTEDLLANVIILE